MKLNNVLIMGLTGMFAFALQHVCAAQPTENVVADFWRAVHGGDQATVERYIDGNLVDINAVQEFGGTALISAAKRGKESLVASLLERGADVNARDWNGYTGLHNGRTALHRTDNAHIARLLLDAGANVSLHEQGEGRTPLDSVLRFGSKGRHSREVVALLLRSGASVNARNFARATPLFSSFVGGKGEWATELLLAHGAHANAVADDGSTPLHRAAGFCCLRSVQQLLEAGADVHARTHYTGFTPLFQAAGGVKKASLRDIIILLFRAGADLNARDNFGETPMLIAMKSAPFIGAEIAAEALIECGASVTNSQLGSQAISEETRKRLIAARNIPVLRQALAYLDQEEHAHGTRVPTDLQNLIRDMVLTEEQKPRFEELR